MVYRVTADNEATSVKTRSSHGTFQYLGILNGVPFTRVIGDFRLLQLGSVLDGIGQVHLRGLAVRTIGQTIRDSLAQLVGTLQWQSLHTGHVFQGVLGGHRGIGNNVGAILVAIFVHHPA